MRQEEFVREIEKRAVGELTGGELRQLLQNEQGKPFPLSSPLCLGKAGKEENPQNLPLMSSLELASKEGSEPVDWLVDSLIPKGTIVLLTAPPGSYKTFFALSISRCVGESEPFLGRSVEAGFVTYVDKENPRGLLQKRLNQVFPSSNLTVWPLWANPEPPPLGNESYLTLTDSRSLLVFDSLRRFHTGSENAPEEMAVIMGHLRKLTKAGATVLILHHAGKAEGNAYRGTTEILAGVDIAFSIEKHKEQTRVLGTPVSLTLRCIKHRYIEEPILNLEFLREGERLVFRDVTAEREEEREESRQELFEKVKGIMRNLEMTEGPPNQTKMLKAMKDNLDFGKNRGLKLLSQGEETYWKSEPREGSRFYQTFSPFPNTIGGGKEESPESDPWDAEALL